MRAAPSPHRDARLLFAGQTLSAFGDWAMFIVLARLDEDADRIERATPGSSFFVLARGRRSLAPLGGLARRPRAPSGR